MNIITLDFETFFDSDYTLKKLTTEAYIRDPRFEALLCGVRTVKPLELVASRSNPLGRVPAGATRWFAQEDLWTLFTASKFDPLAAVDWSQTAVLAHHAQFDGLILSHHYGIKPAFWFDTLSMARMIHGNHLSVSLDSLSRHYGLEAKSVPYDLFRGRRWADLDAQTRDALGRGSCHDVELTWSLFGRLSAGFPREELAVIDATIRMFTEPTLIGDQALFERVRDEEWLKKNETLYELGVSTKELQSATKFVGLLEAEGVQVARKPSPSDPTKLLPAIAATDQFMRDLCDDDNERVAALAQARLESKSTLNETRAGRLAAMSSRGAMAVYLSYYAAHTSRWGGGDRTNFQNFPRGGDLRRGLRAPDGCLFLSVDQSQGECRVVNWLAGQSDVVERFRLGEDPYLPIASQFYGREVTKADVKERGTGKQLELSCGFGAGWCTVQKTAARGTYGPPVYMPDEDSQRATRLYRETHKHVVASWGVGGQMLVNLVSKAKDVAWGPLTVDEGRIYLPNGAPLDYTGLEWHQPQEGQAHFRMKTRAGYVNMYGAKLVENVVQALSRLITSQAMLRIIAAGYRVVGMAHDDLWVVVEKERAEEAAQFLIAEMSRTPEWAPGLPLAAECKVGATYA